MKKVILIFIFLVFSIPTFADGGGEESIRNVFSYDRSKVRSAFADLESSLASADSVKAAKPVAASDFEFMGMNAFYTGMTGGILSVCGSFTIAGIFAGPAAVLYVYLDTDKNNEETKEALKGCILGGAIGLTAGALLYIAYIVAIMGAYGGCCYYGI